MYPKAVKERRLQKSSHFMEEIDMKSITPATHTNLASRVHPSHPAHRSHPSHTSHHTHPTHPTVLNPELESNRIYVPNIRPGQPPVERRLPTDTVLPDSKDARGIKLSLDSMQRLHKLIEAQKNFLKYYEMREKVDDRRRQALKEGISHFPSISEAQVTCRSRSKVQEEVIPPVVSGSPDSSEKENSINYVTSSKSRKFAKLSESESSGLKRKKVDEEPEVPEKFSKVDKIVLTESQDRVDGVTQTEPGVQITLTTRRRVVAKLNPEPQNRETRAVSNKPWRSNMKPPTSNDKPEPEKPPEPKKPEKPWRVNMKPNDTGIQASVQVVEKQEKTERVRAWRTNMKTTVSKPQPEETRKKIHYDRESVRKFMKEKKRKEKEEKEELARREVVRQEVIKQRLEELEKLRKQIAETEFSQERENPEEGREENGISNDGREKDENGKEGLDREGEEKLRQMLLDLTNEMKAKWKIKQDPSRVYSTVELEEDKGVAPGSDPQLSRLSSSLSDASDATELKSLPESKSPSRSKSPTRSVDRDVFSGEKANHSSGSRSRDGFSRVDINLRSRSEGGKMHQSSGSKSRDVLCGEEIQHYSDASRSRVGLVDEIPERDTSGDSLNGAKHSIQVPLNVTSQGTTYSEFKKSNFTRNISVNLDSTKIRSFSSQAKSGKISSSNKKIDKKQEECRIEEDIKIEKMKEREKVENKKKRERRTNRDENEDGHKNKTYGEEFGESSLREKSPTSASNQVFGEFIPRFPDILSRGPRLDQVLNKTVSRDVDPRSLIKPVPGGVDPPSRSQSQDTLDSEKPPQWIEVTMDSSGTEFGDLPGETSNYRPSIQDFKPGRTKPDSGDPTMNMSVSEGPLSPDSSGCSEPPSQKRYFNPSKLQGSTQSQVSQSSLVPRKNMDRTSETGLTGTYETNLQDTTDPASTMKDVLEHLNLESGVNSTTTRSSAHNVTEPGSKSMKNNLPLLHPDSVPNLLHLRFLTELNQLESVTATEKLLSELEQIRKSTFENQQNLAEVENLVKDQQLRTRDGERKDEMEKSRYKLQEMYSEKLKQLLDSQTEATLATSAVAIQLGDLKENSKQTELIKTLNKLQQTIENLNQKEASSNNRSSTRSTPVAETGSSSTRSKKGSTRTETDSSTTKFCSKSVKTRSVSIQPDISERDIPDSRTISSAIIIEASSLSSRPSSSVREVLEQNQFHGESISQTISEAIASISDGEQRTRSNITAEVEEELSTDYSSQFEEDSTLREKSFRAVLPSETHRRRSEKFSSKPEYSSDASESSGGGSKRSERGLEKGTRENSSLFSDSDSFTRFTLEMVEQYMMEETARDKHKEAILRLKEKALVEKAAEQVAALEKLKSSIPKSDDDKMPKIKKRQRSILLKLKEQKKEMARMREILKIAETERRFLIRQQKSIIRKSHSSPDNKPELDLSENSLEFSKLWQKDGISGEDEAIIKKKEVIVGLKKMEELGRFMTSKEKQLLKKSGASSSKLDKHTGDIDLANTSTESVLVESNLAPGLINRDSLPMSPSRGSRLRHSSADSEADVLTSSLLDTTSEQSDIEARIAALNDQLQTRIKTAARLKKEQRREKREKLKTQEQTILRQIEVYDKLISQDISDITVDKQEQMDRFSKPMIKSPRSKLSRRLSGAKPENPENKTENPSNKLELSGSRNESPSSLQTSEFPSYSQEDLSKGSNSSQKTNDLSTSTILASPVKEVSLDLYSVQEKESNLSVSEVIEEALESLSNLESSIEKPSDPISDNLDSGEESVTSQTLTQKEDNSLSKISTKESETKTSNKKNKEEKSSISETGIDLEDSSESLEPPAEKVIQEVEDLSPIDDLMLRNEQTAREVDVSGKDKTKKIENRNKLLGEKSEKTILSQIQTDPDLLDSKTDIFTAHIWQELLKETSLQVSPLVQRRNKTQIQGLKDDLSIPSHSNEIKSIIEPTSPTSPSKQRPLSPISPRSKPQDLMLTTFDISPGSSEENTPENEEEEEIFHEESEPEKINDDEFFEDDFGLSAIREKAEALRLQQLKVEQEIALIQSQESEPDIVRKIPDKPPPPYVPPARPAKPTPPRSFIPSSVSDYSAMVTSLVKKVFSARANDCLADLHLDTDDYPEPENLSEPESSALRQYNTMLLELVVQKVEKIYENENLEQNPPWMPAKPIQRLKFQIPKSKERLEEMVKKQVLSDLRLGPRVEKESIMVRWAGKKRDRVDEILVRELQEEEEVWTDFSRDEVEVKDQLTDAFLQELIDDTVQTCSRIYKNREK